MRGWYAYYRATGHKSIVMFGLTLVFAYWPASFYGWLRCDILKRHKYVTTGVDSANCKVCGKEYGDEG